MTLDDDLMRYICDDVEPEDCDELKRVSEVASFLEYKDGNLHIRVKNGYAIIPPIRERERIVAETALAVGVISGDKVFALLRERYFWRGMRKMCVRFCDGHRATQLEKARFKSPPYFFPTSKGCGPFEGWAIDCITGLDPPHPNGGTTVVMAVDVWTKWIEYRVINPLDSRETSMFLY